MDRYLNPFTDFGFKKLFGDENNKDLLIDFLNEVIRSKDQIKDLTFRKTEHLGSTETDRKAIFDLYCENEEGEKFIIELQKIKQSFFKDRSLYYATFPIQEQAERGNWDYQLKAVYTVGRLDFVFDEDKHEVDKLLYEIKLMDTERKRVFYDKLTFYYLEMPKFRKKEEELETHFDKWLYVLRYLPYLQSCPVKLQEKIFQKVFAIAEMAKFTPQERHAYEDSLKYYRDLRNSLDTAKEEGWKEGRKEGKKEGKKEGRKEGIQIGEEKGLQKGKLEMAKVMKDNGESIEKIQQYTRLSRKQIEDL